MFEETRLFMEELEKNEYKGTIVDEDEDKNVVRLLFRLELTDLTIFVFFRSNGTAAIRGVDFLKVTEDQFPAALLCCNELNKKMLWVKFYIDDEMNINLEDDAILDQHSAGEEVMGLVSRMLSIADDVYPTFNKAIWGTNNQ